MGIAIYQCSKHTTKTVKKIPTCEYTDGRHVQKEEETIFKTEQDLCIYF